MVNDKLKLMGLLLITVLMVVCVGTLLFVLFTPQTYQKMGK